MRVVSIGGGPAALYFGILVRQAFPEVEVEIHERNRPDDTFGFGVVFSDETLSFLDDADPASAAEIRARFRSWTDIRTWYRGAWTTSTGHGFSALSRVGLLDILQRRAVTLGCDVRFQSEARVDDHLDADLVLGADGVNSAVRERFAPSFRPTVELGHCRFSWLGTDLPLDAFTFLFVESEYGLFQVHAYPFEGGRSTFIVETHEEAWRAAGLDRASEEETVATCERLFAPFLDRHRLFANRSIWRQFPTVSCASWRHRNVVLMGDAVHTAHFSIGSGTKLAMEDSIALVAAFREHGWGDVPATLAAYEEGRRLDVAKLQRAAKVSRRWFEQSRRYLGQDPVTFTFNLMTRSKRITYDNLRARDPELVATVDRTFADAHGAPGDAAPPAFVPFRARSIELANRIVVSPMCQYSADDGVVGDWHLAHLGARAVGGAGLVIAEMTDVEPAGRISFGCAGLWNDVQRDAWRRIVDFVHARTGARIGIQLAHAGRKGSATRPWEGDRPLRPEEGAWETIGPSALPFGSGWPAPREMDRADLNRVRDLFVAATRRADAAGFDWLELHAAHGYLLSSFLSPLSNTRDDEYGGTLANRMRWPLEVFRAMRAAWPEGRPMSVRITGSDWLEEEDRGITVEEAIAFARELAAAGCDVVDVSSAGNSPESKPEYGRMYQAHLADAVRHGAGVAVMTVGGVFGADHANTILGAGRADLVAIARAHLADPHLTARAAAAYGLDPAWPPQYLGAKTLPRP